MASPTASSTSARPTSSAGANAISRSTATPANIAVSSASSSPALTPRPDSHAASPSVSHRSSFAENLRNYPPSPRTQRNHSFSGQALTDLLMNPPVKHNGGDAKFKGRDWRSIQVQDIIDPTETRFVELDTSIEDTTKLLIKSGAPNVVLVRESRKTKTAISTFGYDDLNAYLLLVLGLSHPDEEAAELAERARGGETLPLKDLSDHLGRKEDLPLLPHTANLTQAMEVLGGGAHRVIIVREGTSEAVGILSQLRLVRFFWENHQNFPATERLYARSLKDLDVGAKEVVAINGDKPVSDALRLMHDEGITSLPVLDVNSNVVGNISHVDVKLLTDTSAIPLLSSSCIHFVSIILTERGVRDGKDSFPVFHVTPFSTLAHAVAKLCATRSHRMWIVDAPSPSTSVPPSPGMSHSHPAHHSPASAHPMPNTPTHAQRSGSISAIDQVAPGAPFANPAATITAAQMPGAIMSGHLSGVISLTDILNMLARASGLSPNDPEETRRRRRRSSSSSARANVPESVRSSLDLGTAGARASMELGRSGSTSSRR